MAARGGYLCFLGEDGSPLPGTLETVHVRRLLNMPGAQYEVFYALNQEEIFPGMPRHPRARAGRRHGKRTYVMIYLALAVAALCSWSGEHAVPRFCTGKAPLLG